MVQSISSLAFKGSVTEAIIDAKRQKKLFVVYMSGDNSESSDLETSTWAESSLAEVLSKYCVLLHISEGSADAANLSAIYPQKSSPCITVIGYNGLQLWQNEGFVTAEVLASSLEKAWLNLHFQETAASVLAAALAAKKTEQLAPRASGSNLPGQGTSSSSDAPSPSTDKPVPYHEARTPTNIETVDDSKHLHTKDVNLEVGNNVSLAPENEPVSGHAEQASTSKVNESLVPVKLEPELVSGYKSVNVEVGRPVREKKLVDLRSEGNKVTSEVIVDETKSAVQAETFKDNENDDRDFSLNKSDVYLNIRLPDRTSLQEKFSLISTLREVKNYVDEKQERSTGSYDIAIPYPRKVFGNEDLSKTLSELGLLDRQSLILVPRSKVTGYRGKGSASRHQTTATNNTGSSSGHTEGYLSFVKRIISYVNPLSYFGGGTNSPGPNPTLQNNLRNVEPNQSAAPASNGNRKRASNGNRKRPTASQFGSNIHTLKHDEDDDRQTRDRNTFWNGNSTQYGGDDNDGK